MINTISVYIKDEPVYIGDYSFLTYKQLFFEALALMTLLNGCRTPEDFFIKTRGESFSENIIQKDNYLARIDNNYWLERRSTLPIKIDLTKKVIYGGIKGCPSIKTAAVYNDFMRAAYEGIKPECSEQDYLEALTNFYMPFDHFKPKRLRDLIKKSKIWQDLCLEETREFINYGITPGRYFLGDLVCGSGYGFDFE